MEKLSIDNSAELDSALKGQANEAEILIRGKVYDDLLEAAAELVDLPSDKGQEQEIVRQVVVKAIALLLRSRGKEIILRDRRSGISESYTLWKPR
jgi:hypothetical protein